jgi:hypothetical protein
MPNSKNPKVERRAKTRHRAEIQIQLQLGPQQAAVSTRDVCMNGLSCHLPEPLNLFTKYRFRLFVPIEDGRPEEIDGEGIVVRVEEVEEGGANLFQTAFFFQHLDEGHLRTLESFLESVGAGAR